MLSVTSDIAASASHANAPPKPVLPDLSRAAASFAALVDSNTPGDIIGALPPEPSAQAPTNDPQQAPRPAASTNSALSNQTPPSNQAASPNPNDPPPANSAGQQNNAGATNNNDSTNNTQTPPSGNSKPGSSVDFALSLIHFWPVREFARSKNALPSFVRVKSVMPAP